MKTLPHAPFLPLFRRHSVVFERGEGVWLFDEKGGRYLDLMAGIAVSLLGHAHPALVRAISEQAAKVLHTTSLFHHGPGTAAAEAIVDRIGPGGVFFCNSGTEANEAAIKLVRKRAWRAGQPGRTEIVAIEGSFHGRTLGSLSITVQPAKWEGFAPLPAGVVTVPFDDVAALEAAVGEHTAAVFIEPIQGEIGIRPISDDFAKAARALTTEHNAMLVVDEIQTGMGRTGAWWGIEHYGIRPDTVTLAKGLGGGVPAGALWVDADYVDAFQPSDHGTTQGGNPLACAAAVAVFETIEKDGLIANARKVGESLRAALAPLGTEVRGRGLLLAVELGEPIASDVVRAGLERGIVVNDVNPTSIRLAPPLIITEEQALEGAEKLRASIEAVRG
ncbi:MAG: acetylornithine/succinylornithine family transaminase [Actinomycetota bacterium]